MQRNSSATSVSALTELTDDRVRAFHMSSDSLHARIASSSARDTPRAAGRSVRCELVDVSHRAGRDQLLVHRQGVERLELLRSFVAVRRTAA